MIVVPARPTTATGTRFPSGGATYTPNSIRPHSVRYGRDRQAHTVGPLRRHELGRAPSTTSMT